MSVTAVGPALDLDGPLPVARRHSLLDTRLRDPEGEVVPVLQPGEAGDRWLNGVNVYGYPEGTPESWDPCSTGTFRVKEEGSESTRARFDSTVLYFPLVCSRMGIGSFTDFAGRAERALDATLSHGVEAVLAGGVVASTNPFLGDTNLTVLGPGAVSPAVGKSYLENAIASLTGKQGIIHATPAVVDRWGDGGGLEDLPDGLYTTAGTPVVSGSGYVGVDPVSAASPQSTKDWAFATGPVQVRVRDGVDINEEESLDRADNTVVYRAEKYVLVSWDTVLQVGVLIDWGL